MRTVDESTPTIHSPPPREVLDTVHKPLRVKLTNEEWLAKGVQLASLVREHTDTLASHKEQRSEMKAEIDEINGRVLACRADVATGTEVRSVECEEIADYNRGVIEISRIDTGEVVDSRPLSEADRQRRLA